MTQDQIAAIITGLDQDGNKYTVQGTAVYLRLKNNKSKRPQIIIGNLEWITPGGNRPPGILYTKPVKRANIYKQGPSWGINYYLATKVKYIKWIDDYGVIYKITDTDVLREGTILQFKRQGLELQIYVPIPKFWIGNTQGRNLPPMKPGGEITQARIEY